MDSWISGETVVCSAWTVRESDGQDKRREHSSGRARQGRTETSRQRRARRRDRSATTNWSTDQLRTRHVQLACINVQRGTFVSLYAVGLVCLCHRVGEARVMSCILSTTFSIEYTVRWSSGPALLARVTVEVGTCVAMI